MKFIALKTEDGRQTGKLALYCRVLGVSRQAFYQYLRNKHKPWKYEALLKVMREILAEDVCNDTYGRKRMWEALCLKAPEGVRIPSERTVYRIMQKLKLVHRPKRGPKGLTKADKNAQQSDNLLKRDFSADKPLEKCVTDITELQGKDGKLYVSVLFDCFDLTALGLTMATHMRASLCVQTIRNAYKAYPGLRGAICHSDRGSQYTSREFRETLGVFGLTQSMNSAGGRCHDNARCESMWGRMKSELFYGRIHTKKYTVEQLKTLVWNYYMSYWNNRRICSANGGLPPLVKRQRYYDEHRAAA